MVLEKSQEPMAKKIPSKRKYDSSRRKEQARQTRLQITEAARTLFVERGYAGATIEAIAEQAGVAQETVYAIFGSKRKILSFLLDISVGGDDQPVRILDRSEPQTVLRDPNPSRQVAMFAEGIAGIMGRAAPVFEIMNSAAKTEPEIASLVKHIYQERLENIIVFVKAIARNGPLRHGLEEAYAGEIVWTLTSPEVFLLLTVNRAWPKQKYIQWLADTLYRVLLP